SVQVQAIIPAAGAGLHQGESSARVLMPVGGRSLIRRTLEAFDRCAEITRITLLISQRNLLEVARELEGDGWRKAIDIRLGGERRQDSVRLGLQSLAKDPPDFVIVHDGARPLISDELIHAGLEAARQHGAATAAIPVRHTYKHVDRAGFVHGTVERSDLQQIAAVLTGNPWSPWSELRLLMLFQPEDGNVLEVGPEAIRASLQKAA